MQKARLRLLVTVILLLSTLPLIFQIATYQPQPELATLGNTETPVTLPTLPKALEWHSFWYYIQQWLDYLATQSAKQAQFYQKQLGSFTNNFPDWVKDFQILPQVWATSNSQCTSTDGNTQGGGTFYYAYQIKTSGGDWSVVNLYYNPSASGGNFKEALYNASSQTLGAGNPTTLIANSSTGAHSIGASGFVGYAVGGSVTLTNNTVYWIVSAADASAAAIWGKGSGCNNYFGYQSGGNYANFPVSDLSSGWTTGGESTGMYLSYNLSANQNLGVTSVGADHSFYQYGGAVTNNNNIGTGNLWATPYAPSLPETMLTLGVDWRAASSGSVTIGIYTDGQVGKDDLGQSFLPAWWTQSKNGASFSYSMANSSWACTYPASTGYSIGYYCRITATIVLTATSGSITASMADNAVGGKATGQWFKQAYFNGSQCYNQDIDTDGTGYATATCNFSGLTIGNQYTLYYQYYAAANGSDYGFTGYTKTVAITGGTILNSHMPKTLLQQTASTAASGTGWQDISITTDYEGNGQYWLAVEENNASNSIYSGSCGTAGLYRFVYGFTYGAMPSTFSATAGYDSSTDCYYLRAGGYWNKTFEWGVGTQFLGVAGATVVDFRFYTGTCSAGDHFQLFHYEGSSGGPANLKWYSASTACAASSWNIITVGAGTITGSWNGKMGQNDWQWNVFEWDNIEAGPKWVSGAANTGIYKAQTYGSYESTWSGGTLSSDNWSYYLTYTPATSSQTLVQSMTASPTLARTESAVRTQAQTIAADQGASYPLGCAQNTLGNTVGQQYGFQAQKITVGSANITVTQLNVFVSASGVTVKAAIFTDSSGPANYVASTGIGPLTSGTSAGWVSGSVPNVQLTKSTSYWLVAIQGSAAGSIYGKTGICTQTAMYYNGNATDYSNFPTNLGYSFTSVAEDRSIYLMYNLGTSSTGTLGCTNGAFASGIGGTYLLTAVKITVGASDVTVSSISIGTQTGGVHVKGAVYTDSSNSPNTYVSGTSTGQINSAAQAYVTGTVSGATLTHSTVYWIVVDNDGTQISRASGCSGTVTYTSTGNGAAQYAAFPDTSYSGWVGAYSEDWAQYLSWSSGSTPSNISLLPQIIRNRALVQTLTAANSVASVLSALRTNPLGITTSPALTKVASDLRTNPMTMTIGNLIIRLTGKPVSASMTVSPTTARVLSALRSNPLTFTIGNSIAKVLSALRTDTQTMTVTPVASRTETAQRTDTATMTVAPTVADVLSAFRTNPLTMTVGNAIARIASDLRTNSQSMTLGNVLTKLKSAIQNPSQSITVLPTVTEMLSALRTNSVTATIGNGLSRVATDLRTNSVAMTIGNALTKLEASLRTSSQPISTVPVLVEQLSALRTNTVAATIGNSLQRILSALRTNPQSITTLPAVSEVITRVKSLTQAILLGQSVNGIKLALESLSATISTVPVLGEVVTRVNALPVSITVASTLSRTRTAYTSLAVLFTIGITLPIPLVSYHAPVIQPNPSGGSGPTPTVPTLMIPTVGGITYAIPEATLTSIAIVLIVFAAGIGVGIQQRRKPKERAEINLR